MLLMPCLTVRHRKTGYELLGLTQQCNGDFSFTINILIPGMIHISMPAADMNSIPEIFHPKNSAPFFAPSRF